MIGEWIKKIRFIHTMEYYLVMKKNEIMPFATIWIELEIIILSEVRQRQIPYGITYMWNLKYDLNKHIYETKTDSWM